MRFLNAAFARPLLSLPEKPIDVTLHSKLRPAHTEFLGFLFRLSSTPTIARNAIAGDDGAGAILTMPAVDKHRLVFRRIDNVERLLNFLAFWRGELGQRDIVVAQSQRSSFCTLGSSVF